MNEKMKMRAFGDPNSEYYELTQDLGFLPKGTIFVHDKEDHVRGSLANGCLKLCFTEDGNCPGNSSQKICGETVIFHTEFINTNLFKLAKKRTKVEEAIDLLLKAVHTLAEVREKEDEQNG